MKWLAGLLAVLVFCGGPALAHPRTEQGQRGGEQAKPAPSKEVDNQVRQDPPAGQPWNVKVDLTITDDSANLQAPKKTVTMIVANGSSGYIRTFGNDPSVKINVDARPRILQNGSIHVQLGLEYNPRIINPTAAAQRLGSLNQSIGLYLDSGKPLVLSQSADPETDRKITVEVRATILK